MFFILERLMLVEIVVTLNGNLFRFSNIRNPYFISILAFVVSFMLEWTVFAKIILLKC